MMVVSGIQLYEYILFMQLVHVLTLHEALQFNLSSPPSIITVIKSSLLFKCVI